MDYQKIYSAFIERFKERQHEAGMAPDKRIMKPHRVIPKAVSDYPNAMYVYAYPHEIFVLRRLNSKLYPDNAGVQFAFQKTKEKYFARNNREVKAAIAPDVFQYAIDDLEAEVHERQAGCWDEGTSLHVGKLHGFIRQLKREKREAEEQLEDQAARFSPVYAKQYVKHDYEADRQMALMNEAMEALNPMLKLGNTLGASYHGHR